MNEFNSKQEARELTHEITRAPRFNQLEYDAIETKHAR